MAQKADENEVPSQPSAAAREVSRVRNRIRVELEQRGVSPELASALALRLQELVTALGVSGCKAVCDAALVASGAKELPPSPVARGMGDLDEISRLMGAFVEELGKLDEALRLLTTYLGRIRDRAKATLPGTLH